VNRKIPLPPKPQTDEKAHPVCHPRPGDRHRGAGGRQGHADPGDDRTGEEGRPPPETVTTTLARAESWETSLSAVGSLSSVQGVTVAAELPGKVVEIAFEPGAKAIRGDLLIRQDTSVEEAQLPAPRLR